MPWVPEDPRQNSNAWIVQTLVYGALVALIIYVVWRVLQAQGVV